MAIPSRPARGRKPIRRGPGKRIVEGKSFRLADEVRYIQRRAGDYDGRIVTVGQLVLFSTETGDAWLLDPGDAWLLDPGDAWLLDPGDAWLLDPADRLPGPAGP